MNETIEDIIRRIVREELAKMTLPPQVLQPACTCGTTALCRLHQASPYQWSAYS